MDVTIPWAAFMNCSPFSAAHWWHASTLGHQMARKDLIGLLHVAEDPDVRPARCFERFAKTHHRFLERIGIRDLEDLRIEEHGVTSLDETISLSRIMAVRGPPGKALTVRPGMQGAGSSSRAVARLRSALA